jgi:phage-related minor tail protein
MKTNNPLNDDEALRSLLREWRVETPIPPRFQEQVWRRIEREDAPAVTAVSPWRALQNWIANVLPRPALAAAYVAVLLAAGAGVGWTQAQHESSRVSNELSTRYVQSVDPYQAAR